MNWQDYRELIKEINSFRNRVKPQRLKRDMGKYGVGTSVGSKKAQEGSPYDNVKVSFKGKGYNDISAPALEEEIEEDSFVPHDKLHAVLWQDGVLDPVSCKRLVDIAQDFIDGLEVEVPVEDIRMTGSLANFNWSRYSDIDIHILVDFSKINMQTELVKAFFDEARLRWNDSHRILVHGFEVEIYVESVEEEHRSSGIYSLMDNGWIREPDVANTSIDFDTAFKKALDYRNRVDCIADEIIGKKKDYEMALRYIEKTKEKLRQMRQAGLESEEAEFSAENIAFKILRRDGTLKKLNSIKTSAYDQSMTLREE